MYIIIKCYLHFISFVCLPTPPHPPIYQTIKVMKLYNTMLATEKGEPGRRGANVAQKMRELPCLQNPQNFFFGGGAGIWFGLVKEYFTGRTNTQSHTHTHTLNAHIHCQIGFFSLVYVEGATPSCYHAVCFIYHWSQFFLSEMKSLW